MVEPPRSRFANSEPVPNLSRRFGYAGRLWTGTGIESIVVHGGTGAGQTVKKATLIGVAALLLAACETGTPQTGAGSTAATGGTASTGAIAGTAVWANIDCGVVPFAGCAPPPVTVNVKRSDGTPVTTWHGAEGAYRVDGLAPGSYSVEVYTDAPGDAGGAFGSPVPVQAGITTPNIDVVLQPPAALCLLVYQGHDATVSFNGPGANDWCSKVTQTDGNWFKSTATAPAAGLTSICSGTSHAGVVWGVFDSGGQVYGHQGCGLVNQLSAR
jgi:hypothetical protein